jgi:hypothetical protein
MLRPHDSVSSRVLRGSFTAVALGPPVIAEMLDSAFAEQPVASAGLALGACRLYELLLRYALNQRLLRRLRRELAIREANLTPSDSTRRGS